MVEQELIRRLKENDESAMKEIFDRWHQPLCVTAFTVVKDKDAAKDVVQETLIRFWRNREQIEISISLGAYLKRAVVNTALNFLVAAQRIKKHDIDKASLISGAPSAVAEISFEELNRKATEAIGDLPARTRTVFTLIRSNEMTYKEAAATLNISVKAVEKEMMRALKLLREALKHYLNTSVVLFLLDQVK